MENIAKLGIELMKIDITNYLLEKLPLVSFRPFPNGSYVFSLEDQLIDFEGSFMAENGEIKGLYFEFTHDFTYVEKDPETGNVTYCVTECVFFQKDIEEEIKRVL